MGERYLVTGVQLGLLIANPDELARKILVDEIIDKQFVGNDNDSCGWLINLIKTSDKTIKEKANRLLKEGWSLKDIEGKIRI